MAAMVTEGASARVTIFESQVERGVRRQRDALQVGDLPGHDTGGIGERLALRVFRAGRQQRDRQQCDRQQSARQNWCSGFAHVSIASSWPQR
jgi:hypothetical protein